MALELRLIEYTRYAGKELHYSAALPRAMYTAAGSLTFEGVAYPKDEGFVSTGDVRLTAGSEGAAIWRWEVAPSQDSSIVAAARSVLRLAARIDLGNIADELLIRLDSVSFPPQGTAIMHTHQGPGIRCLSEGTIRIDTEGRSASDGPGAPWFESGPKPVFAQVAMDIPSRFIRAMVLPQTLLGTSSIRYVTKKIKRSAEIADLSGVC